jgi:glycosyltransferase involved in cell wall biosynthesis
MPMLRLSICVTTRNSAPLLRDTLRTILNQSYSDFEVLVVDAASTDDTRLFIEGVRDTRVRYIRTPSNAGLIVSRNRAIAEARGDVIAIYHDHDLYHPDLVRRSMHILDEHPRVGIVCAAAYMVEWDKPNQIIGTLREKFAEVTPGRDMCRELFRNWRRKVVGPTAAVRRLCYERLGVFNPEYGRAAGRDFELRVLRHWDLGYIAEPMARLRTRDAATRLTAAQSDARWRELQSQVRIHQSHLDDQFRGRPLKHYIETQRLRMTHLKEFWRASDWLLKESGDPQFAKAAVSAFRATGLRRSAGLIDSLGTSATGAGLLSAAGHLYTLFAVQQHPNRRAQARFKAHNAEAE